MSFDTGYALVIGVGSYANEPALDVPITADDARAIWNVLTDPGSCGYPAGQVTLLTDEVATREGILVALDTLAKQARADATVMIFFSGHGVMLPNEVFALTTHDLRRAADGSIAPESVITAPELLAKLRQLKARKVLCLLNACHSGGANPQTLDIADHAPETPGVSVPRKVTSALLATGKGRIIMTACQENEVAYVGDGDLTVFPGALVAALEGNGIANRRGFIGAYDLYDRVYEVVTAAAPQQPELTVNQGIGPFPVALFQGSDNAALDVFEAPATPARTSAVRTISQTESLKMLQEVLAALPPGQVHNQAISGNAQVGTAVAGNVEGGIHNRTGSDDIRSGDITGSSGIAIGRGARSTVRNVNTGGGDYSEGSIDKRQGVFGGAMQQGDSISISGNMTGANINVKTTLTDVVQTIGDAPSGSAEQKAELQHLIVQLNNALQQAPAGLQQDAEVIAEETRDLIEKATQSSPNPRAVENRASSLRQAAEHIRDSMPAVLTTALLIIEKLRPFVSP